MRALRVPPFQSLQSDPFPSSFSLILAKATNFFLFPAGLAAVGIVGFLLIYVSRAKSATVFPPRSSSASISLSPIIGVRGVKVSFCFLIFADKAHTFISKNFICAKSTDYACLLFSCGRIRVVLRPCAKVRSPQPSFEFLVLRSLEGVLYGRSFHCNVLFLPRIGRCPIKHGLFRDTREPTAGVCVVTLEANRTREDSVLLDTSHPLSSIPHQKSGLFLSFTDPRTSLGEF